MGLAGEGYLKMSRLGNVAGGLGRSGEKLSLRIQILKSVSTDQTTLNTMEQWQNHVFDTGMAVKKNIGADLLDCKCPQLQAMPTWHSCLEMALCQSGSPEQG